VPTVAENKQEWNDRYNWEDSGHEWSGPWGTATDQWSTTILRRIFQLLPTQTVLEIASSQRYIGIDISERCVGHCRRTFGPLASRPTFLQGTGMDLAGVATNGVSFAFSFDSLVHAEADCLAAYAKELFRVIEPGGHAFLHHSNFGEYLVEGQLSVPLVGWRGRTVTAEWAREMFVGCGFHSIAHEKITWVFDGIYSDCFTLVRKPDPDRHCTPPPAATVFYNDRFSEELAAARLVSTRYTRSLSDQYGL
jgi:Methyltransferase domain